MTSRNVDNSSSLRGLSKSTRPNKSPENFPTNKSPENFPNNLPGTPTNFLRSATGLTLQRTYNCSCLKELKICKKTSICPDVEDGAPKRPATNASARKCTLSQNGYGTHYIYINLFAASRNIKMCNGNAKGLRRTHRPESVP